MADLPKQAKAVIIGGGVVGCSIAYHLTKLGWTDVVLLERKQLTSGTTWHAAGLIGQLRATRNMTMLAKYSAELYTNLEAETGVATGFRQHGSVAAAKTLDRFEEYKRGAAMGRTFGLEVQVLTPEEICDKYPLVETKDLIGGIFLPKDGQADPANIAHALAKGARMGGAQIFEAVKVTGITQKDGRVTGVTTDQGKIAADYVVNAAGMWGREVGRMAGVNAPLQACEHFYILTEPIADLPRDLPVFRMPEECAYYKEDAGKLLVGAFEPTAKPWAVDGIPDDFCFDELPEDWDHFEPILEAAVHRMPVLEQSGIQTFFNGPESFTPDDRYLLGEAPELKNFYLACGFNSIGIQSAGGAGKALSEWMDTGAPQMDLSDVDIRRMEPFQGNKTYLTARVTETLGLLFADHFPYRQYETARGVRHSPLHDQLAKAGACFGETAGWERPNWIYPTAETPPAYTYGWARQPWMDRVAEECEAVRTNVGLFDLSSFAKFRVEGRDAVHLLQKVSANNVDVAPGRIVYTQWLNARGGIEADLTVTRLSETAFLVVTAAAHRTRDLHWLNRHTPEDAHVVVTDVTAAEAVIAVMGPKCRDLLSQVSPVSFGNNAFPFATAQEIEIGMGLARAHRISYVGELGWELYVPSDMARHVFDVITEAGSAVNLRLCGFHALDSLRLEKAFRHIGHDITDEDHVFSAGLGFAVRLQKPDGAFGPFIGRDAVLSKKDEGLSHRLVQFRLEDPAPQLYGHEPILAGGEIIGHLTSGAYGHHLGAALGLGYITTAPDQSDEDVLAQDFQIDIAGELFAAQGSLTPLYDPTGERMKG